MYFCSIIICHPIPKVKMKKLYIVLLVVFSILQNAYAQTNIFKEVSDGISTKIRPIIQDETLVGYPSCTELERANRDLFSYRITIMDPITFTYSMK
jgi:hypothetical protein